jgi:hypothetical protein
MRSSEANAAFCSSKVLACNAVGGSVEATGEDIIGGAAAA